VIADVGASAHVALFSREMRNRYFISDEAALIAGELVPSAKYSDALLSMAPEDR